MKIIVIEKGNPRRMYVANLKDWLNPDICTINVKVPFIGGTDSINKANYEIGLISDENGEENLYFEGR
jgi:hypothetical protein